MAVSITAVAESQTVGNEDTLHESLTCTELNGFVGGIHLCGDMSFVVRLIVVLVDDPYAVHQSDTVFVRQPGAREEQQHPARIDIAADAGMNDRRVA